MNRPLRVMWFVPPPVVAVVSGIGMMPGWAVAGTRNASSDEQFAALVAGQVDVVVTAMDNVLAWNRRPGPGDFRIVAQIESTTPLHLVARPGLGSLADLRQRTVLVDAPENGFVVALRALLADAGLAGDAIRLQPAGGVKERYDALLAGQGDCTLLGPPFDTLALKAGMLRLATVQERYPAFPGQALVMRAVHVEAWRAPLTALLHGWQAASARMAAGDPAVRQALVDAGYPEAVVPALLALRPRSLRPDRAGVELVIGHRRQLGLPGGDDRYEALVDESLTGGLAMRNRWPLAS